MSQCHDLRPRSCRSGVRDGDTSRTENLRLHVLAQRQLGDDFLTRKAKP
jgi:hypothetical protein